MTDAATGEKPKDASASVAASQAAMLKALPFSDTRDFDDATRGFLGTLENARVVAESYDEAGTHLTIRGLPAAVARLRRVFDS